MGFSRAGRLTKLVDARATTAILALLLCVPVQAVPPAKDAPSAPTPKAPDSPAATQPPAPPVLPSTTLQRSVEVRARLLSGGTFAGKVDRWDGAALHGTFGSKRWAELVATDLKRVFLQLLDRKNGAQWLALGELLAASPDGAPLAEDAFKQAQVHGRTAADVTAARARAQAIAATRAEQARAEGQKRLQKGGAATVHAPPPWPVLTPDEQSAAVEEMRGRARKALEVTSMRGDLTETRYFIICGDLPTAQQQAIGRDLDGCCSRAMQVLGFPQDANPFWGKALVVAVQTEDSFKLAEAAVFNAKVTAGERAALHTDGPRVSVACWKGNQDRAFNTALMQQMTLGLLYRTVSAAPLPEWAADGFALWSARVPERDSHVDQTWRPVGLQFMRQPGPVLQVMQATTADGSWPGPNGVGRAVGFLLVDMMLGQWPQRFGPWIQAIKRGAPWPQALKENFGVDAQGLASGAIAWYRTNDGPPRR